MYICKLLTQCRIDNILELSERHVIIDGYILFGV
jgi:hypothetical protein